MTSRRHVSSKGYSSTTYPVGLFPILLVDGECPSGSGPSLYLNNPCYRYLLLYLMRASLADRRDNISQTPILKKQASRPRIKWISNEPERKCKSGARVASNEIIIRGTVGISPCQKRGKKWQEIGYMKSKLLTMIDTCLVLHKKRIILHCQNQA